MKRVQVDVTGQTAASPPTVYEVAKDSSGYPRWSRIGSFEHVRSGRDEPYGVGSVRIFRTWPLKIVEEVVELVPQRRVSYIVHRGLPFRDYRADIELAPSLRRHHHSLAEFVLSDGSRHRLPVPGFHAASFDRDAARTRGRGGADRTIIQSIKLCVLLIGARKEVESGVAGGPGACDVQRVLRDRFAPDVGFRCTRRTIPLVGPGGRSGSYRPYVHRQESTHVFTTHASLKSMFGRAGETVASRRRCPGCCTSWGRRLGRRPARARSWHLAGIGGTGDDEHSVMTGERTHRPGRTW